MTNKIAKLQLVQLYGRKCMLCKRKLKLELLTFHHIKPKENGGEVSLKNGALLCKECQEIIHTFKYEEDGYKKLTSKILKNKRSG